MSDSSTSSSWIPSPSPTPGWELIPLAEQFDNHDEFRPDATDALTGREATLLFDDGTSGHAQLDGDILRWTRGGGDALPAVLDYEAVEIRPEMWALTVSSLEHRTSALAVVDEQAGRVLINLTSFPDDDGGEPVEWTSVLQAGLDRPLADPFRATTELIGKRVAHRYSTTHVFEHIYLNPNTYAFQGLRGPEAGVGDVDRADYWKLGDDLYLFSWHERAQPFNGAVVIDLDRRRATGRLVGWDAASGRVLQVRTGSRVTVLSTTSYEGI